MGSIERMQKYTHTHTHICEAGRDYSHFLWYNRSLVDLIRMNGFELKLLIILFMCVLFLGVHSIRNMLKAIELVCFRRGQQKLENCTINRQISESNHFVFVFFSVWLNNSNNNNNDDNEWEEINSPQSGFSFIVILFANLFVYFVVHLLCVDVAWAVKYVAPKRSFFATEDQ